MTTSYLNAIEEAIDAEVRRRMEDPEYAYEGAIAIIAKGGGLPIRTEFSLGFHSDRRSRPGEVETTIWMEDVKEGAERNARLSADGEAIMASTTIGEMAQLLIARSDESDPEDVARIRVCASELRAAADSLQHWVEAAKPVTRRA
jgi:hypothetical protein